MLRLAVVLLRIAAILSCIGTALAQNDNRQDSERIVRKVGVLAHRGDEAALRRWQPTLDAVSAAMPGHRFEAVPLTLDGVRASLTGREIDYLFTNPGHLYRLEERFQLSPIAALRTDRPGASRTGNRFGAVILVRADNEAIATLADLKGAKLAAVAPDAFGGFEIAADTLVRNGVDPWRDIASVAFLGFPQHGIIDAVLDGSADAGTVRTGILEAAVMAGELDAGDVRILNPLRVPDFDLSLSTQLVPEWIFSSTGEVDERERREVAIALLRMPEEHPALKLGNYGGWTTVPSDFAVRRLLGTVDGAKSRSAASGVPIAGVLAAVAAVVLLLTVLLVTRRMRGQPDSAQDHDAAPAPGDGVRLTPRESEILTLVGNGLTTKEIARDLGISPKTVEFHRGHLMRKYEAHNMAELISKAGRAAA